MPWGEIIGAAIGAGASLLGARSQNREARRAAERQIAVQRYNYKHRYQWTMDDMRAAGLNPILAYQTGVGGSPGGSTYSPVNVGAAATTGAMQGVNSAAAARRAGLERDNIRADTVKKRSEGWTADNLGRRYIEETKQLRKQQKLTDQQIMNMVRQYQIMGADLASANALERLYRKNPQLREIEAIRRSLGIGGAGSYLRRR